ncbi:DNA gyrase inhibitor YacG [Filomicrobium sp.]|uniref:DNA gyrase inhibitor YacG n=1 Tax=Filomicrobium sp. TaxID=2024831 RepID=UPI0025850A34|nr:DNA gyrase inhibitor YacG [Filomicrobium sp.]MCV0370243.1 DNA gyrase inhibitor YacG [Filomicrobium sp.]
MSSRVKGQRKCPICGSATEERWRPFCSRRCADVDLARWMSGRYAIPGGDADADEDGDKVPPAPLPRDENAE